MNHPTPIFHSGERPKQAEGIYWADYTVNGLPSLYYVDQRGERLYETQQREGESGGDAEFRVKEMVTTIKRLGAPVPPPPLKLLRLGPRRPR